MAGDTLAVSVRRGIWVGLVISAAACFIVGVLWLTAGLARLVAAGLWAEGATPKDRLDVLYDIAGISVPFIALIAGFLTFRQLAEAKDTRVASLYLQINERYNGPLLRDARRNLKRLLDLHTDAAAGETLGEFVARQLTEWSARRLDTPDYQRFNSCMRMMEFWEETAVLVRRGLVDRDVLFDYQAGSILHAKSMFLTYVSRRREAEHSRRLYANALWLMAAAGAARPGEF